MTHLLARRYITRHAALAASALLIVAASAATLGARPAKAAECWGSSCDLADP